MKTYIYPKYYDERGYMGPFYKESDIPSDISFVEDRYSVSTKGIVRGFHGDTNTHKLVTIISGTVQFVTYDLIKGVKFSTIVSDSDKMVRSFLVKPNMLNGHQCLSDKCIFLYKWSNYYSGPQDQISVNFNDDSIGPEWTIYPVGVSERDRTAKSLRELGYV